MRMNPTLGVALLTMLFLPACYYTDGATADTDSATESGAPTEPMSDTTSETGMDSDTAELPVLFVDPTYKQWPVDPIGENVWRAVWVLDNGDVFIGGDGGTIAHYDGNAWTRSTTHPDDAVFGFWSFGTDQVLATTGRTDERPNSEFLMGPTTGGVYEWDGSTWILIHEEAFEAGREYVNMSAYFFGFLDIWGAHPDSLFVATTMGVLLYNGTEWNHRDNFRTRTAVWGMENGNTYAVGQAWNNIDDFRSTDLLVLDESGTWGEIPLRPTCEFTDREGADGAFGMWGTGDVLFMAGDGAVCMRRGDEPASTVARVDTILWDIWGSGPSDIYAVGSAGALIHYDGTQWSAVDVPTTKTLMGIHGTGPDHIYAVGADSTVLHYNGTRWLQVPLPL